MKTRSDSGCDIDYIVAILQLCHLPEEELIHLSQVKCDLHTICLSVWRTVIQDDELRARLDVAGIVFCQALVETLVRLDKTQNLQVVLLLQSKDKGKGNRNKIAQLCQICRIKKLLKQNISDNVK